MPEILPNHVPSPRTLLAWDGTAYRPVSIDAAGQLQVDVATSALPAGAATAAAQALALGQLQLIEDLRNALQSVNADALQVRGENQLFSYHDRLDVYDGTNAAAAGANDLDSVVVPAGEVWVVTWLGAQDIDTACTSIEFRWYNGAQWRRLPNILAPVADTQWAWSGHLYLREDDQLRAHFEGCVLNDDLRFYGQGYVMTEEV